MAVNRKPRAARNPYFGALTATFTINAQVSTARTINVQLANRGADAAERVPIMAYLSSDAAGDVVHATAPSGGWAVGTDGSLIASVTTNKVAHWITEADGDLDIVITSTAWTGYLNVLIGGRKFTSAAIVIA